MRSGEPQRTRPVDLSASRNEVLKAVPAEVRESVVPEVPVTLQHLPPADLDKHISEPGKPRNAAQTKENPDATPTSSKHTPLQQHVLFWDRDHDGKIYPWDTYVGFRRLGFNVLISFCAIFPIHGTFSYMSQPSWLPDPMFSIHIDNMHRTKHGSDSETYDTEGRFVPQKYEEIFSKFDKGNKGALSWEDIQDMVYSNMNAMDPTGWIAERLEWWFFWLLAKDEKGLLSREKVRGMYDGSLWNQIASEVEAKKALKQQLRERKRQGGQQKSETAIKRD